MADLAREEFSDSIIAESLSEFILRRPDCREFRPLYRKLIQTLYGNYRNLAKELCQPPAPPMTLEELIDLRTDQIKHVLNDPADGDPRVSLIRAIEEKLLGGKPLPSSDYGFNPSKP